MKVSSVAAVHAERAGCRDEEAAGGRREEDHQRRALVSGPARALHQRVRVCARARLACSGVNTCRCG